MEHQGEQGLAPLREPVVMLDAAVGVAGLTVGTAVALARRVRSVTQPITQTVLRPPLLPRRFQPGTVVTRVVRRGTRYRDDIGREVARSLDAIVPLLVSEVLSRVDLTEVVRKHVDLEAVVSQLDLTELVAEQVDLDRLVALVDLDAAATRLDLDAVIERVDLASLAREVIEEIDLPEIIRGSTRAVASDTLLGVRMQGISGDEAVGRVVERLRIRLGGRSAGDVPPDPPGGSA